MIDWPMRRAGAAARREAFAEQMQRHLDADGLIVAAVHDPLPLPGLKLLVRALAGHADISTTQRYLDVNSDQLANAVELL